MSYRLLGFSVLVLASLVVVAARTILNHDVNRPGRDVVGVLAYRHFQYRSLGQMTRKLRNGRAAYQASDIHPMHGTHWRQGGLKTDDELAADWAALCAEDGLVFDQAPLRVTA